ncbi:MAG: CcdB family protein, partial [Hafniaceae bacterium]|nr:CcdB family protein [Hafniaceae bacterium]
SLAEQERLILSFKIEEHEALLMTPQMAGVALSQLGEQVDDLGYCRDDIVAAMDFLIFGY